MHRKRIGVVSGGPSNEYEVSLATGKNVIAALKKHHADRYSVHDIFVDKTGNWHKDGAPLSLSDASNQFDVIFNALHGAYGEDGKIQQLLEMHQIPFTGSGSVGSAVAMNKMLAKKTFAFLGIKIPHSKIISEDDAKNDTSY
ncbi:MAG: hypothetical protein NTZ38_01030 [Candidatus Taylorbacteria bacterium]|nr:hypothetical protein [Candidatus Taylorbacteria bacterium]